MNKRKLDIFENDSLVTKKIRSSTLMRIHPQYLNKQLLPYIESKLISQMQHKWTEEFGFIRNVQMLPLTQTGKADTKSGYVEFLVNYNADAIKPFTGQIMEAVVSNVTKLGIHFESGPLKLFMHEKMLPSTYFFVNNLYKCQKTGATLKKGDKKLVKIVGTSWTDLQYISIVQLI